VNNQSILEERIFNLFENIKEINEKES